MSNQNDVLVSICCITYNQASYIRQCFDGLLMQETNFKYEIVIHDDCSTDGTTDIVCEYAEKYPDIIVPILQRENQYQSGNKRILASFVFPVAKGKYFAFCEGDDYWTDPLKLQKQVDFLESHLDYSMVCNRTKLYSQRQKKYIGENYCYNKSQDIDVKDIILRGGLFISTCSILMRRFVVDDGYPDYFVKCHVGDYPLQILAAMKGNVYYLNDVMSVYRVENSTSWAGKRKTIPVESGIVTVHSEIDMLNGFSIDYPQYKDIFTLRKAVYINQSLPNRLSSRNDQDEYLKAFEDEIAQYSLIGKIDLWMRRLRIRGIGILCPFNLGGRFESKISR